MAITNTKRANLQEKVGNLEEVDTLFDEVKNKLDRLELELEDIVTVTLNVDNQSETLAEETKALCKLIDALRLYNSNMASFKTKLKEVASFL